MKPYASYKPSGVSWLGDLPSHWGVNRLKELCTLQPSNVDKLTVEGQAPVRLCNYVDVYKNERITSAINFMGATATSEQIERLGLRKGDVVVTKDSESPWDIAVPTVIAEDIDSLVCGYHLTKLEPQHAHGCFIAWALRCYQVNLHFALSACGITRYGLGTSALGDGNIPAPPVDEQQAIADYLDTETARIDTLIREKDELIGLLREARVSVVDRAVQPGSVKLAPLKRFAEGIATGPFGSALHAEDYVSGGPFLINPTHIANGKIVPDADVSLSEEASRQLNVYRFKPGDIVVGRRGEMGRCAVVPDDGETYYCGTGCLMLFPATSKVVPAYLAMVISSTPSRDWLSLESVGSTMENLNSEILARLPCAIPSLDEQHRLLERVELESAAYEALMTHVEDEIALLKELRAATIADAVLGRMDVRTALIP